MSEIKILLVEDNKDIRFATGKMLTEKKFKVVAVENGEDALSWCFMNRADIILMDITLPGMDGFKTAKKIRRLPNYKETPIIALTAVPVRSGIDSALDAHMNDYLPKPFYENQLIEAIMKLVKIEKKDTKKRRLVLEGYMKLFNNKKNKKTEEDKKLSEEKKEYIFVARQPIFDADKNVYAYELLFRSGEKNAFTEINGDVASSSVITNSFMLMGIDNVTQGRLSFVNITENLLLSDSISVMPKDKMVIEILEDVTPNSATYEACKKLKEKGFIIALDDFVYDVKWEPFFDIIDIIKVDFMLNEGQARYDIIKKVNSPHIKFLAEKVETYEEFEMAKIAGYTYFQGYFFSKPVIMQTQKIPGIKLNYMMMLKEIYKESFDFSKIEQIIKRDVSLTYKLLKFINSALLGVRVEISSIKHALTLLGVKETKKWVTLVALNVLGSDKPAELMNTVIVRAYFCEKVSKIIKEDDNSDKFFLMGMLSLIDAFVDKPIEEILEDLHIYEEIKQGLLGEKNKYSDVLSLVQFYEKGDWIHVVRLMDEYNLTEKFISETYFDAVEWASSFLKLR